MSFRDRHAGEDGGCKGTREGVAGPDGIGHLHLRGLLIRLQVGSKDIGSVHAAGKYEHIKVVLAQQQPALVLHVESRIAEEPADRHQFFIVNLEDVRLVERVGNHLFRIEVLAQIDVEDLQAVLRRSVQEFLDGLPAHAAALCQRAEA